MNSPDVQLLAPWLRRFLVEYMVSEKSYSSRTRQSYRDAYRLLLPFASQFVSKPVERLTVEDLSVECLTGFLESLEKDRGCGVRTRNQRLAAISLTLLPPRERFTCVVAYSFVWRESRTSFEALSFDNRVGEERLPSHTTKRAGCWHFAVSAV